MDSRKQFLVVLLSVVAFFAAVEAVCDSSQPLGYPYPDDDYYNGTVKVEYDKMNFVTRIELKENYPEEGHKNIRIAVFNCENDPDSPAIGTFKPGSGSQMSLGLEVEKDNDNWYLVVNNPQDYEIPSQRYYSFSVLGDGALYDVVLNIENVDDESPYFLMPDSKSCEIKETVIGPSSCVLTAYDPDAIMDDMDFRVLEGGEISQNISLVVVSDPELCRPAVPKDCFTVAINITAELEFINRPVHSLVLEVEDQAGHIGNLSYVVQVIAENKDIPHFTPQQLTIYLDEETPGIVITNQTITVTDRDALDYGQFTLTVEGDDSCECYKAFDVIPRAGYRNTEVKLSVINPKTLDYDAYRCNDIIVKIKAIEITDETRTGEVEVNIKLIDLNDESPVFEQPEYEFSTEEHTPNGTSLGFVNATDRDLFDTVTYSLSNYAFLNVDRVTGEVKVNADFNYGRQRQIFATVRADDTAEPPHFDNAQIVVNVTDINDMRPLLLMPWSAPDIDEIAEVGTVLNVTITASDEDTDPDLSFSIDWGKSRATKQGFPVNKEEFEDYLTIETLTDPANLNEVEAVLTVNRIIHWEVFDTLYVNIIVDDNNTHPDYQDNRMASAMLTVTINDLNDCYPEFSEIGELKFKENTTEIQFLKFIVATDQDGPGFNEVTYYLMNDLYKEEYVIINKTTGEMRTGKDIIDYEEIQEIYYTLVATDGELETPINITINIEDINDNTPYFVGDYSKPVRIPENNTERMELLQFEARDDDLSPEFNTVRFFVDDEYKGTFEVDNVTGEMFVPEGAGTKLDYEKIQSFNVEVTVRDRCQNDVCYFGSLSSAIRITIELTDINDNPPVIQDAGLLSTIAEDEGKPGVQLGYITAIDIDSDENANLTFKFVDIVPEVGHELFVINKVDIRKASVLVKNNLLDNWGDYTVTVMASDPDFSDVADFIIVVTDINNNYPVFVFPNKTTVLRFNIFENSPGNVLSDVNGKRMVFSAIDDKDKGLNGTAGMTYSVIGDDTAMKYLEMSRNELRLIDEFDSDMDKQFTLKLKACDGEFETNQLCTEIETQVIMRLNKEFEPTFDFLEWTTNFTENSTGLSEVRKIDVPVTDLNNVEECDETDDDCEEDKIFYFIFVGDRDTFQLKADTGELSLKQELDREKVDTHTLVVVITNFEDGPRGTPDENSMLTITIEVNDVIDTAPEFNRSLFAAGINLGDKVDNFVTNFVATSYDLNDKLTYSIIDNSMNVTDNSLQHLVGRDPFKINDDQLRLNFDVQDASMRGTFVFKVLVTNLGDLTDEAVCQVYIIAEDNLVSMRFLNNLSYVESMRREIAGIYSTVLKCQSNVKTITRALNSGGAPMDSETDVTSYFVTENGEDPISKDDITMALNNGETYMQLQNGLWNVGLILDSIDDSSNRPGSTNEGAMQIVLIVVAAVLGTLVVVLFAAFFIRTRSLNRRLEAMSTTKFGSQDSGLNRIGMAVPNTNQHAVEGSNPIWGNDEIGHRDFDNASLSSGDSDLIGVEENPEFSPYGNSGLTNDGFTPASATERRVSVNPMFAAGLSQLSAAALQQKVAAGKSLNPLADKRTNDDYDSENDSRRSSENFANQNNNFTFNRMDSVPTTEL